MPRFEIKTEHTFHSSHATTEQVWYALTDFPRYPRWNNFILHITGSPQIGKRLSFTFQLPRGVFLPATALVKVVNPHVELRWKGHFMLDILFSAEHYFILSTNSSGTHLLHGEIFRGLLLPLVRPILKYKGPPIYQQMNSDLENFLATQTRDQEVS